MALHEHSDPTMSNQLDDVTLDSIADDEDELHFAKFDFDDAWTIGSRLVELARLRELPVAIDISRGGQRLFHAALPGTRPDNDEWIERKIRAALRFGHSSLYLSVQRQLDGRSLAEAMDVDPLRYAAAGGCFPVHVDGCGIIATITVSGLPQVEDHRLVVEVIREFLAR
jgi:uncharacterized protein (UPF0303 family)